MYKLFICKYGQDDYDAVRLEDECKYSLPTLFAYLYWSKKEKEKIRQLTDEHDKKEECDDDEKCNICKLSAILEIVEDKGLSMKKEKFKTEQERSEFIRGYWSAINDFQDEDDAKHRSVILLTLEELEENILEIRNLFSSQK